MKKAILAALQLLAMLAGALVVGATITLIDSFPPFPKAFCQLESLAQ